MVYTSQEAYILIGRETTWGTAVTADKDVGLVQNFTPTETNTFRRLHGLSSTKTQQLVAGKYDMTGSIEVFFQNGRLLEYLIGSVAHSEANTPDIKHTFTWTDTLPSFTLEDGYDATADVVLTYAGCKAVSGTIALAMDGSLTFRMDVTGKTVLTSTTAATAVISTIEPLADFQGTLKTGVLASETAVAQVQSCEITFTRATDKMWGLGNRLGAQSEPHLGEVAIAATVVFTTKDEYERFLGGTAPVAAGPANFSAIFDITNGIAAGSGLRQFYCRLANVQWVDFSKPSAVGGYITMDLTGWAKDVGELYVYDTVTTAAWG